MRKELRESRDYLERCYKIFEMNFSQKKISDYDELIGGIKEMIFDLDNDATIGGEEKTVKENAEYNLIKVKEAEEENDILVLKSKRKEEVKSLEDYYNNQPKFLRSAIARVYPKIIIEISSIEKSEIKKQSAKRDNDFEGGNSSRRSRKKKGKNYSRMESFRRPEKGKKNWKSLMVSVKQINLDKNWGTKKAGIKNNFRKRMKKAIKRVLSREYLNRSTKKSESEMREKLNKRRLEEIWEGKSELTVCLILIAAVNAEIISMLKFDSLMKKIGLGNKITFCKTTDIVNGPKDFYNL